MRIRTGLGHISSPGASCTGGASSGARAEAAGTVPPTKHNKEGRPKIQTRNQEVTFGSSVAE